MLLTLVLLGQLALARGGSPAPDIRANDNRVAAGQLARGVLTIRLVAQRGLWYPETKTGPGLPFAVFAEEGKSGTAPGPLIRVAAGTEIHVVIRNTLEKPMTLRGFQDHSSTALDTFEIAAGSTRDLRFRANTPGTFLYWGRTEGTPGVIGTSDDALLAGALIVDPPAATPDPKERVLVITMLVDTPRAPGAAPREGDVREVVVMNGLSWPHTERLDYTVGDTVHWRVINASNAVHPMHLHGFYFKVLSRGDGVRDTVYTELQRRQGVTEFMLPASTMTLSWVPTRPGNWLFHCHLIFHIDARWHLTPVSTAEHANHALTGMSGLVVGLRVSPARGASAPEPAARRSLRLLVTERANVFGAKPGFSFILQDGAAPPAADSVRFPSSTIVLHRNEPTSIAVVNRMKTNMATVHWHGIELESYYDGVAGWSGAGTRVAPAVAPGDSFIVHMTPDRSGTFIYHTHTDETQQLMSGLYGALLVLDENAQRDTTDRLMLIGDGGPTTTPRTPVAAFINGSTDPPPLELRAGRAHRIRLVSISAAHLRRVRLVSESGVEQWRPVAKDGADLPARQATLRPASIDVGPGETADFEVKRMGREVLTLEVVTAPRAPKPHVMRIPVIVR